MTIGFLSDGRVAISGVGRLNASSGGRTNPAHHNAKPTDKNICIGERVKSLPGYFMAGLKG